MIARMGEGPAHPGAWRGPGGEKSAAWQPRRRFSG